MRGFFFCLCPPPPPQHPGGSPQACWSRHRGSEVEAPAWAAEVREVRICGMTMFNVGQKGSKEHQQIRRVAFEWNEP